jgi:hypothetical protein
MTNTGVWPSEPDKNPALGSKLTKALIAASALFCHPSGMTEKVVLALMAKRAEIQGYIQDLETKARRWRARLAHIDATLTIFSPDTDPEAIQPKRRYRRSQYFRGGEFARLCLDVLRETNAPLSTAEIIAGALKAKGLPDDPALISELTEKALATLREKQKSGTIVKFGATIGAKWQLPSLSVIEN